MADTDTDTGPDVIERAAAAYAQAVFDIQLGDGEKPAMAAAIRVVLEDARKFTVSEDEPRLWFGSEWQLSSALLKGYAASIGIRLDADGK